MHYFYSIIMPENFKHLLQQHSASFIRVFDFLHSRVTKENSLEPEGDNNH